MKTPRLILAIIACIFFVSTIYSQTNTFPLNGNVGIGTTTPRSLLEVFSTTSAGLTLSTNNNQAADNSRINLDFYIRDTNQTPARISSYYGYTPYGAVGMLRFFTSNPSQGLNEKMRITHEGNVGIGTTTPDAKLDVNGKVLLRTVDTNQGWSRSYLNWSAHSLVMGSPVGSYAHNSIDLEPGGCSQESLFSQLRMYTAVNTTNHQLKIQLNTMGNCFFNNDGNVGIGTDAPDHLLTVKGTIHAREVLVDLNGSLADFVFHPSYKLMPLNQVEQYVKTNNHLPEIPSAADVKENGLNMGEMQNKLLQKIEELTLYMIEQQKQIDELKTKLK